MTFAGGRGFITYRDFGDLNEAALRRIVPQALEHFQRNPTIGRVEWKTRAHDHAPGLHVALLDSNFVADEPETIMIGDAAGLAVDLPLPDGITLRTVVREADVRAMSAMQDDVFGDPESDKMVLQLLNRLALNDGMQLWIAEAADEIVSDGRLEPIPGTQFAGIWGGATRKSWRGQGIYRALTAARARAALTMGKTLIHSDSTEHSRPILERSGLVAVSTTTPYRWRRSPLRGSAVEGAHQEVGGGTISDALVEVG